MSSKTTIVVALFAAACAAANVSEAGEPRSDISLTTCHDRAAERTDADRAPSTAVYLGRYYGRPGVRTIDTDTLPGPRGRGKRGRGAIRRQVAGQPGDPGVSALQRPLQCLDLGSAAAVVGAGPGAARLLDVDLDAEVLLEALPRCERLREQHPGVDRHHTHTVAHLGGQLDQGRQQHGLLLLEGAQQDGLLVMRGLAERLTQLIVDREIGRRHQTAHSPSPRITWYGWSRSQSKN